MTVQRSERAGKRGEDLSRRDGTRCTCGSAVLILRIFPLVSGPASLRRFARLDRTVQQQQRQDPIN